MDGRMFGRGLNQGGCEVEPQFTNKLLLGICFAMRMCHDAHESLIVRRKRDPVSKHKEKKMEKNLIIQVITLMKTHHLPVWDYFLTSVLNWPL